VSQLLVLAFVFVAVVCLTVATYLYANRAQLSAADAARARLKMVQETKRTAPSILLKDQKEAGLSLLARLLGGKAFGERLALQLRRAGSELTPGSLILYAAGFTSVGIAAGLITRSSVVLVVAAVSGAIGPFFWLRRRERKRLAAFQSQLPDAIDMLVSAMRAGYSFQAAMRFISEEVADPLGPEFARFYDEQRLGVDVRSALTALQERIESMDLKMFVTAVLVQRESGGNLSEVLANISDIMRERFAMQGEIDTLTAESRLSARILGVLPILVFIGITIVNPAFMRPMLQQPVGRFMLAIAAVSVLLGYLVMMSIADIDL
jgi:tight adherence protein B